MTEDKKLNAAESLVLIGRMIENTRNRMAGSAGLHLLTWGYVTVATTLAVWGLASYFDNTHWNYLWFMLPVAGYLITRLLGSETTGSCSRTYVDQVIDIIRIPVTFTILLMIGMGIAITSLILRFTPGIAGGTAGIVLGSVSLAITDHWHLVLFTAGFVLMLIIPGHLLHYRYKHSGQYRADKGGGETPDAH